MSAPLYPTEPDGAGSTYEDGRPTGVRCPSCGSSMIAIARDMYATRHCGNCLHEWRPPPPMPTVRPDGSVSAAQDRLYLLLKGARERLCIAQTILTRRDDIEGLDRAIREIDALGVLLPQWSKHDRTHEPAEPVRIEHNPALLDRAD